jgi:hypothetical protein
MSRRQRGARELCWIREAPAAVWAGAIPYPKESNNDEKKCSSAGFDGFVFDGLRVYSGDGGWRGISTTLLSR